MYLYTVHILLSLNAIFDMLLSLKVKVLFSPFKQSYTSG